LAAGTSIQSLATTPSYTIWGAKSVELALPRNPVGQGMGAIIILGGHRTGTSITARLVHELGFPAAPTADRLLQPKPGCERDNPDGYFEDVAFVRLHRWMLGEHVGVVGGWTNPRRDDAEIRRLRGRYQALVRGRNARSSDWSIKDPRLCLVGDVLLESLHGLGVDVRIVTTPRPESQVITSLMRRGLTEAEASRIAMTFEAGRRAVLHLARSREIPRVEVSLAGAGSQREAQIEIGKLQRFLGRVEARDLARLVRVER
jgi:hypothetical protein